MNHSSISLVENEVKGQINTNDLAPKALFQERLIRNFITYVKQTGDCNYLSLLYANKLELETEVETTQEKETLTQINTNVAEICLNLKDIIRQFAESLHPANDSDNIRNLLEDINQPTVTPYLNTALKQEHEKLSRLLNSLIAIAQKKQDKSLKQFIRDLTYYHQYIQENAQATKIQHDLSQISDSFLYLRRLNQYLDILPETVNNLIDAMENLSEEEAKT